jgi:cobalt-zinc-cadmium efflux system outer membrane protein
MHRVIAAIMAVASCASIARAQTAARPQPSVGQILTLERALALANAASPSTEAGSAAVRAADAARVVAGLRPNPSITVEAENVAGSGIYRGMRSSETTAGLALPIELGGKRSARIAVADAQGQRARVEAEVLAADRALGVRQAYIGALAADRRLRVMRDQAVMADEAFRVTRARVTSGASSPIDQQRAEILRVNARTALERAQRLDETARANLARMIGQPVDGPLDVAWFDRIPGAGPVMPRAADGTLALAAANADARAASAQVRLARSQRVPDVTLSAGARRLAATNDVAAVFGVSVPFPLFNNGAAAVSQARALQAQAEATRRLALLAVEREIANAQTELANAVATARAAAGPVLAAAVEAARIARLGYSQGKFGQIELLEAERTLAQTRADATDALAAYHDAQARLIRLTSPAPDMAGR